MDVKMRTRTVTYENRTDENGREFAQKDLIEEIKELTQRDFGLGLERISTYPSGIELKVFCSSDITKEAKRNGLVSPAPGREITIYSPAKGLYVSPLNNEAHPMEFFSLNSNQIRLETKYKDKIGELRRLTYHIQWGK